MQLAADGTDELCQPPLVRGVDVFIARLDLEGSRLPLLADERESILERLDLVGLEQASAPQRCGVGDAALDVSEGSLGAGAQVHTRMHVHTYVLTHVTHAFTHV